MKRFSPLPFLLVLLVSLSTTAQAKPKAPPTSPKPVPAASKEKVKTQQQYVIRKGENPWVIAKNHEITLAELLAVNEIKDDRSLDIGDILNLPAGVVSKNPPKKSAPPKPADAAPANPEKKIVATPVPPETKEGADWEYYTIQKGDNPWKIAKSLKVDHQAIVQLNDGLDFRKLAIGQKIKVPKKT